MRKNYNTPVAEKIEFNYSQQVVASNNCHWENRGYWSHSTPTCNDTYTQGTSVQVPG